MKKLYHNYLFVGGWLYYLVMPPIMVVFEMFYSYPGMYHLYENYNQNNIIIYYIYIILFLISFLWGSLTPLKFLKKIKTIPRKEYIIGSRDLLLFFLLPLFLLGQFKIIQNHSILFKGYEEYDVSLLGTIATINVIFIFFSIYNLQKNNISKPLNKFLIFGIIEFSIILLGLGSRLYVLLPIIVFLIFGIEKKIVSFKNVFYIGVFCVFLFLFVGLWRLGNEIEFDMMMYIGAAESMFTWISAETYFNNELPLFALPGNFLSSFINFIPSAILPNKLNFILPIKANFYSPFGAFNIIVSLIYNFGFFGSLLIIYGWGFMLTYIRINCKSILYKSYYYCICGIIPFQFFRDELPVVVKMIFYNLLFLPLIFHVIEIILTKKKKSIYQNNS